MERDFKIIKDILDREQKINKTLETTLETIKKSNHDPQNVNSENRIIIENIEKINGNSEMITQNVGSENETIVENTEETRYNSEMTRPHTNEPRRNDYCKIEFLKGNNSCKYGDKCKFS